MHLILTKLFNTSVLVSPVKAMELCKIITKRIKSGKSVNIDFLGVQAITIAFLYIVFSNLLKECEKSVGDLKKFISISNPSASLIEEMKYLKDNYKTVSKKLDNLQLTYA